MDIYEDKIREKQIVSRLKQHEPLKDKMLELALRSIEICFSRNCNEVNSEDNFSIFLKSMRNKIIEGQPLSEYEIYVMGGLISSIDYEERKKERKSRGASYGHITRRLKRNEPLTGKTLELALELVDVPGDSDFFKSLRSIAVKMKASEPLSEYECSILIDMVLPHARLG